ncbi:MAG: hypothetical protein BroJett011_71250 [Chloroflexota bacterium]|nr:MAG: hypothetical protein BroJett011_71250 [Chloroflexota bacterium]
MQFSVQRFVSMMAVQFTLAIIALLSFCMVALAQEPTSFEISLAPQADHAVGGQPFTYTLTITNVSQSPLKDIVVRAKTPAGTTLIDTYFANANWLVGGVQRGKAGEIIWVTQQPIAAGGGMAFDFAVNISPDLAGRQLIMDEYVVTTIESSQPLVAGPPVQIPVLTVPPIPSPTAQPIDTPAPTPTAAPPTQLSVNPSLTSTSNARATTLEAQANPTGANTATSISITASQTVAADTPSLLNAWVTAGLAGAVLFIVGLVWFWKYR